MTVLQQIMECHGKLGDRYIPLATIDMSLMPPTCEWILSVLNKTMGKPLLLYKHTDCLMQHLLYSRCHYQLSDVFIEATKPYFFNDS